MTQYYVFCSNSYYMNRIENQCFRLHYFLFLPTHCLPRSLFFCCHPQKTYRQAGASSGPGHRLLLLVCSTTLHCLKVVESCGEVVHQPVPLELLLPLWTEKISQKKKSRPQQVKASFIVSLSREIFTTPANSCSYCETC